MPGCRALRRLASLSPAPLSARLPRRAERRLLWPVRTARALSTQSPSGAASLPHPPDCRPTRCDRVRSLSAVTVAALQWRTAQHTRGRSATGEVAQCSTVLRSESGSGGCCGCSDHPDLTWLNTAWTASPAVARSTEQRLVRPTAACFCCVTDRQRSSGVEAAAEVASRAAGAVTAVHAAWLSVHERVKGDSWLVRAAWTLFCARRRGMSLSRGGSLPWTQQSAVRAFSEKSPPLRRPAGGWPPDPEQLRCIG